MTTYKAGIIGCGGRGRAHAEGYLLSPKVEIVACADTVTEMTEIRHGFNHGLKARRGIDF